MKSEGDELEGEAGFLLRYRHVGCTGDLNA